MAEASAQPPITERIMDGMTDAQYTASQASNNIRTAGARLCEVIDQTRNSSAVVRIEAFTRAYPLLALTAAFTLGAWVFGRRG